MEHNYNPYMDISDGDDIRFKGWEKIYDETFWGYYKLLIERSKKLQTLPKGSLDYTTYTDICLIMIRALLIESERLKNNYTIQNFLSRHGNDDLVTGVNSYLSQQVNKLTTLRDALKITVDKFIAHFDSVVGDDDNGDTTLLTENWFKRSLFIKDLQRDDYPFSITNIVDFVQSILEPLPIAKELTENSIAKGI